MGGFRLTVGIAIVVLLALGAIYQRISSALDARKSPPPGRLIKIGNRALHADIRGESNPPVVFEAGIAATSVNWRLVQAQIANQTISYDRAGLGWSDPPASRDVTQSITDLRELLDRAQISSPRILVGHSFGGLLALAYAARFPDEIAGLVLVDPAGVTEWAHPTATHRAVLARGIFLSYLGAILAWFGVVRSTLKLAARGSRVIPKLIARASSGREGAAFIERILGEIRKLPPEAWAGIQLHWSDPKCFLAAARSLKSLPPTAIAVLDAAKKITAPIVILSAGNASEAQRADHELLAATASRARLEIIADSGHWIQLDRPEVVVRAIQEVMSRENRLA
jgi:pimeloyl-ACP methyl ester carboxylesterase